MNSALDLYPRPVQVYKEKLKAYCSNIDTVHCSVLKMQYALQYKIKLICNKFKVRNRLGNYYLQDNIYLWASIGVWRNVNT